MSAVFGLLRFDGAAVSLRDLERLGRTMAARGPDRCKISIDNPVGLGQCLMRVTREDRFDVQPLCDPAANLMLVADLRLDNRAELAEALAIDAAKLATMPDSALLLRAYKTWRSECAEHLLGDFAFAIWDGNAGELVLGRDHVGQRYLHYYCGDEFFVFATEMNALFGCLDVPRILSESQIGRLLLQDHSPGGGQTLFEQVSGLPGATVMTVGRNATVKYRRYWEPHANPADEGRDEAFYAAAYRRVLSEAVACRIERAIRPAGLLFSGGYDSAAIAGLAGPVLTRLGRKLVAAASVMREGYVGGIRHARRWVELCVRDMPHLDVRYVTREGKTILTGLDEAFVKTETAANAYHFVHRELLSTLAEAGAQVVMDGHGGDYTLNPRGQMALARFLAAFQMGRFCGELRGHLRLSGHSLWTTLRHDIAAPLMPRALVRLWRRARHGANQPWREQPIDARFAERLIATKAIDPERLRIAERPGLDMRGRMMAALRRIMEAPAPGLAVAAALNGLELTRPFHDKRVVELALAIPQELYVKHGRNRYIACTALRDVYPREFQNRWRKNDDEIPDFPSMLKSAMPRLIAEISDMEKRPMLGRYIDFKKLRALLAAPDGAVQKSGWEQDKQLAAHGFLIARYLKWFWQSNN